MAELDSRPPPSFPERMKSFVSSFGRKKDYQQLSQDEEGRVALTPDSPIQDGRVPEDGREEEAISLLDSQSRRKPKRRGAACCMCCGINCSLFWKIFGVLVALSLLWQGVRLAIWFFKPSPTGLEDMPMYSESLGCADATYIYNSSSFTVTSPLGSRGMNHVLDIKGNAVGTVVIAEGQADSTQVEYSMQIRSDTESNLDGVKITQPHLTDNDGSILESRLRLLTSLLPQTDKSCVRFDITMYVPPNLKKLHATSHAAKTHVKFDPESHLDIESSLFVTVYGVSSKNMILPHENIRAKKLALELINGWLVGDVAVMDETDIKTQRGRGVANVKVHPFNSGSDEPSLLHTVTGVGRTDVTYLGSDDRRPIRAVHMSTSPNSEMYLTYKGTKFDGRIELNSKSYSARNIQDISGHSVPGKTKDTVKDKRWTHFAGSPEGLDELRVDSRAWTGLYL